MNIELIRKVCEHTECNMKTPIHIEGYEDDEVKKAVDELVKNGVIYWHKSSEYIPMLGNYTITEGSMMPPLKKTKTFDTASVSPIEFKKCYGEELYNR